MTKLFAGPSYFSIYKPVADLLYICDKARVARIKNYRGCYEIRKYFQFHCTVKPQWLEHLWGHGTGFKAWVVPDATFYDRINTIYQFIKLFSD